MTNSDHRYYKELLGAYVLGHLEDDEKHELQRHLARCASCRAEAEELGEVVAELSAYPEGEHTAEGSPSPELEDRVVAAATGGQVESETGPRRKWLTAPNLAATSLAVIVLAVTAIWILPTDTEEPDLGDVEPISFTTEPEGISADGEVVAHTWGTEVILEMEGLEEGELYTVEVLREDDTRASAGTLIGDADMPVECNLNGAVLRENAEAISVTDSEGALVLRSDLETRS